MTTGKFYFPKEQYPKPGQFEKKEICKCKYRLEFL